MALNFVTGLEFPKNLCKGCSVSPFKDCNIGFERCVYSPESISLFNSSRQEFLVRINSLKSIISGSIKELEQTSFSKENLKQSYEDIMDLSSSFEDIVLVNVRSKKTPELAAHMRQQLLHHFNTALTVVSNSLFLSYKLNQPAQKTIENLRHVYGRVESFEKILTTMEKNPSLLDYLLSLHLPESIPELSSSDQIPRFSPSS